MSSLPATTTLARVGRSRPAIRLSSVVLPEPDGPISATKRPREMRGHVLERVDLVRPPVVHPRDVLHLDHSEALPYSEGAPGPSVAPGSVGGADVARGASARAVTVRAVLSTRPIPKIATASRSRSRLRSSPSRGRRAAGSRRSRAAPRTGRSRRARRRCCAVGPRAETRRRANRGRRRPPRRDRSSRAAGGKGDQGNAHR